MHRVPTPSSTLRPAAFARPGLCVPRLLRLVMAATPFAACAVAPSEDATISGPSGGQLSGPSGGQLSGPSGGQLSGPRAGSLSATSPGSAATPVDEVWEGDVGETEGPVEQTAHEEEHHGDHAVEGRSVAGAILLWLPNRIFDVLDVVRARVRIGPGWTFSVRATELADINMGAHATVFVGLHGPREEPIIPWPFGLERFAGLEVSVADASDEQEARGPRYGPLEVGLGFQALIVGADVGVEVWEALDFVAGIVFLDPVGDDF